MSRHWVASLLLVAAAGVQAQQPLKLPSLDKPDGEPVMLDAFWFPASTPGPAPAIVLLHGCGGAYERSGRLAERERRYAALLNDIGVHALVVDSLTARGERELCTQKIGTRKVNQIQRRRDALGALQWLAQRGEVDPARIGLLGFSNGGSTVLSATNLRHGEVARAPVKASFAVAFYPGCATKGARGYQPSGPVLLLVGEADDWTPAAPCKALAAASPQVELEAYADAHHGFDSLAPVRHRADVPNGTNAGGGVHSGGNPVAREASRKRLLEFLQRTLRRN